MRDTDLMQLALGLVPPWMVKACAFDADKREGVVHIGCLAHARRKFDEALKAQRAGDRGGLAAEGLAFIQRIYRIEKAAREANLEPKQRKQLRYERARPVWDEYAALSAADRLIPSARRCRRRKRGRFFWRKYRPDPALGSAHVRCMGKERKERTHFRSQVAPRLLALGLGIGSKSFRFRRGTPTTRTLARKPGARRLYGLRAAVARIDLAGVDTRPFARSIGSGDRRAYRAHGAVLTVCFPCCGVDWRT